MDKKDPQERGARLRARSDVAHASPAMLAMGRQWWLWAVSAAGAFYFSWLPEVTIVGQLILTVMGLLMAWGALHLWRDRSR